MILKVGFSIFYLLLSHDRLLLNAHHALFQVLTVASVLGLASPAPVGPLSAAVGATVGALGKTGAAAAFGTAGLGAGMILKKLVTGDGSIPKVSLGLKTGLGLGPLRLGGKVGAGFGGVAPGTWYQPLSEEESLLLQAQLGLGLGQTNFYTGAGAGLNLEKYKEVEQGEILSSEIVEVGEFVPVGEVFYVPASGQPVPGSTKPFIEFASGAVLGPFQAGERFTVGSGSAPQLSAGQHNLIGTSEGLSFGSLNIHHQTGLGFGF